MTPSGHCFPRPVATPVKMAKTAMFMLNSDTFVQTTSASSLTSSSVVKRPTIRSRKTRTPIETSPNRTNEKIAAAATIACVRRTEIGREIPIRMAMATPKEKGTMQKAMMVWFGIVCTDSATTPSRPTTRPTASQKIHSHCATIPPIPRWRNSPMRSRSRAPATTSSDRPFQVSGSCGRRRHTYHRRISAWDAWKMTYPTADPRNPMARMQTLRLTGRITQTERIETIISGFMMCWAVRNFHRQL
mmetsp:Transcript_1513/g.3825  ORF Transcript_1513/g.3825 Transcript_1513/m.3825 type:complete len:245 (+) Transcript_1513:189-923(+)